MKFTKMHGNGNDYIILNCMNEYPDHAALLAKRMSDRHFGIGGDGLILICPSERADFQMRMFNADGSEGAMCGNGIRCAAKYVYDKGLTAKRQFVFETAAGMRPVTLLGARRGSNAITVDMGAPIIGETVEKYVNGINFIGVEISTGNPHLVIPVADLDGVDVTGCGPLLSGSGSSDEVNVEFVRVLCRGELRMRVWERGSGETLSCGTGACAACAATAFLRQTERQVTVYTVGGALEVRWDETDGHLYLTGSAETVFEGELYDSNQSML